MNPCHHSISRCWPVDSVLTSNVAGEAQRRDDRTQFDRFRSGAEHHEDLFRHRSARRSMCSRKRRMKQVKAAANRHARNGAVYPRGPVGRNAGAAASLECSWFTPIWKAGTSPVRHGVASRYSTWPGVFAVFSLYFAAAVFWFETSGCAVGGPRRYSSWGESVVRAWSGDRGKGVVACDGRWLPPSRC